MYNKNLPYNDLPLLPVQYDFDQIEILKVLNEANISLSELKGTARLLPDPELVFAPLSVKESVASSGIENIHTTVSEAFKADVTSRGQEKEVLNYRDALIRGKQILLQKGGVAINDIEELQGIIDPINKGIRTVPGVKIKNLDTGEVVYTPPEGQMVLIEKLSNFEKYYNNSGMQGLDTLIKMAILHYQIEAIHPFKDGNGRVGRILMVLYLVLKKRLDLPILFLSGYILNNRQEYSQLLKGVTEKNNWKPWVLFILNGVKIQSDETTSIILKIKTQIDEYEGRMVNLRQGMRAQKFISYLFSNPYYTQTELEKNVGVHRNTAASYLEELQKNGILKSHEEGKHRVYYNQKLLDILE